MGPDSERRVAVVTGGAVRLGAAIANELAQRGWDLVLHHRTSGAQARTMAKRLEGLGAQAWLVEADFSDPDEATRAMAQARRLAGRVDLLVNSASVFPQERLPETDDALLHRTMAINAWAPLAMTRAFAEGYRGDDGCVVNVLDAKIHRLTRERFAYQLSKQTLAWLTRATALEYAPRVRVNGVAPGAVLPPAGEDEAYLQRLAHKLPLKRAGAPEDVAEAVAFLARSRFVTGVVLEVDGGDHLEAHPA